MGEKRISVAVCFQCDTQSSCIIEISVTNVWYIYIWKKKIIRNELIVHFRFKIKELPLIERIWRAVK
jgi:hypothetical protein